jgi:hypothetical protein
LAGNQYGSYPAPTGPDWGGRIEVVPEFSDAFLLLMFNNTPDGEVHPAVEAEYARQIT